MMRRRVEASGTVAPGVARGRRAPVETCAAGRRVRGRGCGRLEQLRHRRRVVPHARGVHLPPRRARRPQPGAPAPGQSGCRAPAPGPGAGGHACRLWPLLRNVSAGEARDHRGVHGALAWLGGLSRPPPGPRREPCPWRAPAFPPLHLALLAPVRGPGARKQDPLRLQRGLGTGLGARCAGRGEDRLATDHAYARRCRLLRGARPRGNRPPGLALADRARVLRGRGHHSRHRNRLSSSASRRGGGAPA